MIYEQLTRYAQLGLIVWLALLAIVVFQKLIMNPARMSGLLAGEAGGAGEADRVQLLMVAAVTVGGYLLHVSREMARAAEPLTSLPEAPPALLAVLVGGQSIYLSGKLARKLK